MVRFFNGIPSRKSKFQFDLVMSSEADWAFATLKSKKNWSSSK